MRGAARQSRRSSTETAPPTFGSPALTPRPRRGDSRRCCRDQLAASLRPAPCRARVRSPTSCAASPQAYVVSPLARAALQTNRVVFLIALLAELTSCRTTKSRAACRAGHRSVGTQERLPGALLPRGTRPNALVLAAARPRAASPRPLALLLPPPPLLRPPQVRDPDSAGLLSLQALTRVRSRLAQTRPAPHPTT